MDILNIFAWVLIVLSALGVILSPLLFGSKREYTYASFVGAIINAIIAIPLALRVLGKL